MKSISRLALGVALVIGGASVVATAPAAAQKKKGAPAAAPAQPGQPAQRQLKLSKEERAALQPLQAAVAAKNWASAQTLLPAAAAAAQSSDARYAVAYLQLQVGLGLNDVSAQSAAIDALIASGGVPASELANMYRNQGVLATNAKNMQKAEAAFTKVVELAPTDTDALINLAQVKNDLRRPKEALQLIQRAIDIKRNGGQAVDQTWYKYALKLAFDGRSDPALRQASVALSRQLVSAYPTKENWRDALLIFRDTSTLDAAAELDLLRLMRVSGSLAGERDWYDLADNLYRAGNFAEAKAVLDDGASKRMVDPKKAAFAELLRLTNARLSGDRASLPAEESKAMAAASGAMAIKIADAWMGYKEYGKAVSLYRAALGKTGVDPSVINTRLGIALLASGDRAAAEAAFRAVTGPRAELAGLWLAHLARPVA